MNKEVKYAIVSHEMFNQHKRSKKKIGEHTIYGIIRGRWIYFLTSFNVLMRYNLEENITSVKTIHMYDSFAELARAHKECVGKCAYYRRIKDRMEDY